MSTFITISVILIAIISLSHFADKYQSRRLDQKFEPIGLKRTDRNAFDSSLASLLRKYSINHTFETELEGRTCYIFISDDSSSETSVIYIGCAMLSVLDWPDTRIKRRKLLNFGPNQIQIGDPQLDSNWIFQCESESELLKIVQCHRPRLLEKQRKQKSFRISSCPTADEHWTFSNHWVVFVDRWVYKDTNRVLQIQNDVFRLITEVELQMSMDSNLG